MPGRQAESCCRASTPRRALSSELEVFAQEEGLVRGQQDGFWLINAADAYQPAGFVAHHFQLRCRVACHQGRIGLVSGGAGCGGC